MDSRKLSLLAQAVNTFLDGYWPKEVVEDWRYKKLREASEAALAQQAQPEDGTWMQLNCNSGGTGHYFAAYVRCGESLPYLCNEHKGIARI